MKRLLLIIFGLAVMIGSSIASSATTVTNDAHKYVNTNDTNDTIHHKQFTTSSFTSQISSAFTFEGNISDHNFLDELASKTGLEFNASTTTTKIEIDGSSGSITSGTIIGVLLKAATDNLYVAFNQSIDTSRNTLYWNTIFSLIDNHNSEKDHDDENESKSHELSHYVLVLSPVPIPAAIWLFAPALLGFASLRRKQKV